MSRGQEATTAESVLVAVASSEGVRPGRTLGQNLSEHTGIFGGVGYHYPGRKSTSVVGRKASRRQTVSRGRLCGTDWDRMANPD